jgi:hypothetical protein
MKYLFRAATTLFITHRFCRNEWAAPWLGMFQQMICRLNSNKEILGLKIFNTILLGRISPFMSLKQAKCEGTPGILLLAFVLMKKYYKKTEEKSGKLWWMSNNQKLKFKKFHSHCRKSFESAKWQRISLRFVRLRPFGRTSYPASMRQNNWPWTLCVFTVLNTINWKIWIFIGLPAERVYNAVRQALCSK